MPDLLFNLPENKRLNLQTRIREMLVSAILDGHLPPGSPVPSGRKLAQQLKVARNTVVIAYEHLVDEGYLVARERSGFYVSEDILKGRAPVTRSDHTEQPESKHWQQRFRLRFDDQRQITKPQDWQRYPYPFLYGQFDPALFPIADWRDCCRDAASIRAIHSWASDRADKDDPELIDQIHTRVLPRRGVWVHPDEILITLGAQHALFLATQLLVSADTTVGIEEPGYTDARNVFLSHTQRVRPLKLDTAGLVVDDELRACDYVHVTPSHQFPTTVTMPLERRRLLLDAAHEANFVVFEDDYESELNYADEPIPALKSMDTDQRVIYIGSLSKSLSPGLRMGYLVGPRPFIQQARVLRRLMLRHPPANNQYIVSQFLRRGYHDALVRRLHHTLRDRWKVMNQSLADFFPDTVTSSAFGGSAFWVQLPEGSKPELLERRAREQGVLIEAGDVFYFEPKNAPPGIRLGFSSISSDRIHNGLQILSRVSAY